MVKSHTQSEPNALGAQPKNKPVNPVTDTNVPNGEPQGGAGVSQEPSTPKEDTTGQE